MNTATTIRSFGGTPTVLSVLRYLATQGPGDGLPVIDLALFVKVGTLEARTACEALETAKLAYRLPCYAGANGWAITDAGRAELAAIAREPGGTFCADLDEALRALLRIGPLRLTSVITALRAALADASVEETDVRAAVTRVGATIDAADVVGELASVSS